MQKICHGRKIWLVELVLLFTCQYSRVCIRASSAGASVCICWVQVLFKKFKLCQTTWFWDKWNAFLLIYCHLQITEGLRTKWCVRCKPLPINCNVLPNQGVVSSNINDFVCNFFLLCNGCSSVDLFDEQFWVVCTQADIKPYYRFCFKWFWEVNAILKKDIN